MRKKIVLVLHGFPGLSPNDPIRRYFSERGWELAIPDLFRSDYKFSEKLILRNISETLNGQTPDLIVGASMGGLILPLVIKSYPKAKVLLIATGPRVSFQIPLANKLLKRSKGIFLLLLLLMAKNVPTGLYKSVYKIVNPNNEGEVKEKTYERNILEGITMFKNIKFKKMRELVAFFGKYEVPETNKNWGNETLILTGSKDRLMPPELSQELKKQIRNSVLIKNADRLHYDVFDERDFARLDEFLK